jgi:hypothetical protein
MIHGPPTPAAGGGEPRSVVLVHVFFLETVGKLSAWGGGTSKDVFRGQKVWKTEEIKTKKVLKRVNLRKMLIRG